MALSAPVVDAYHRYLAAFEAEPVLCGQHAGNSYPRRTSGVLRMVDRHFVEGVGGMPVGEAVGAGLPPPGLVAPHLDFKVGGSTYSYAYDALLRAGPADTYVILGVGHRCPADVSLLAKGYRTVLGEVACDGEMAREIEAAAGLGLRVVPWGHWGEHSVEFAVVYLQALARRHPSFGGFRIVPLLCGGMHEELAFGGRDESVYARLADALGAVTGRGGRRVCVVGSIDGSHVGPRFGHEFAVDAEVLREIEDSDYAAWAAVEAGDMEAFWRVFASDGNRHHFDGVGVLFVMMRMFRGRARFRLLRYDQWYERADRSVVTLASGVFEGGVA